MDGQQVLHHEHLLHECGASVLSSAPPSLLAMPKKPPSLHVYMGVTMFEPHKSTRSVSPNLVRPIYTCKTGALFGMASNEGGAEDNTIAKRSCRRCSR